MSKAETSSSLSAPSYHTKAAERAFKVVLKHESDSDVNQERQAVLRDLFADFFREETANVRLFRTEDGVSVPYTSINLTEFAKKLYRKHTPDHSEPPIYEENDDAKKHRYVVFPAAKSKSTGPIKRAA